jgi:hypothetical protein
MTGLNITSSTNTGVYLNNTAYNPVTVASGVTVTNSGFPAIGSVLSTYWTIVNSGTLLGTSRGSASDGVLLANGGGAVTNTAGGYIAGYYGGVSIADAGTVVNRGSIATTGTSGSDLYYIDSVFTATAGGVLLGGGGVSNAQTGFITSYFEGVAVGGGGSVVNAGYILGSSTTIGLGVVLAAGGSVTNTQSGQIEGGFQGIVTFGLPSTVINQGYVIGGSLGVGLNAGGVLSNASTGQIYGFNVGVIAAYGTATLTVTNDAGGTIGGGYFGVYAGNNDSATVTNAGFIAGYSRVSILLLDGGTIDNKALGRIDGGTYGIVTAGSVASTIINAGSVHGFTDSGIRMNAGGSVINTGGISGVTYGIDINNDVGTVINAGTISTSATFAMADTAFASTGVLLTDGGVVTNSAGGVITSDWVGIQVFSAYGSVMNAGLISASPGSLPPNTSFASVGVQLVDGGAVTNVAGGTIASYSMGVQVFNGYGTVVNAGIISASAAVQQTDTIFAAAGVQLVDGGVVTNSAGGTIQSNWIGVQVLNAPGTVINAGSISDAAYKNGAGVQLADGGLVTNAVGGNITSEWMGVQAITGGTVVNQGVILAADFRGDGAGVWIHGPGAIINEAGGVISGGGFGIVAYAQTTVVNQGTVFGTEFAFYAKYSGFADRIIDLPGGVFSGVVSGGDTLGSAIYSTLELASGSSTGTIANIGTFTDFGQIALDAGATWSVGGSIVAGEPVVFGGTDASLILASPSAAAGATMTGFAATDTIVLSGITDVTNLSFDTGNTLTVTESGGPGLTLQFDAPQALDFAVVDGSTDIFVPCFLPGTHILTDLGEVLVEKLRVGDAIVTRSGQARRLCWIGQGRTLATRGRRTAATPVIVRKGALADNVPHLDLHITKGHSLYFDGVLIPVEFLVNHRSILWDDRAQEVTVFHLELDAHDVLVANGVAAESYRDDGNRWLFQNANAGWDQPPKAPCAPVMTGGPVVDAVWQRILDRAGPRPGLPLTDDPDLHLVVDGVRVDAAERQGPVSVFRLAGRPASVRVASREAVPAELGLARDARSLGVALRRVAVRQGTKFVVLKADDPRLADGFHAYEAEKNLRWTDGNAALPVEAFARFTGGVEVVVHVAETTRYPNDGTGTAQVAA